MGLTRGGPHDNVNFIKEKLERGKKKGEMGRGPPGDNFS